MSAAIQKIRTRVKLWIKLPLCMVDGTSLVQMIILPKVLYLHCMAARKDIKILRTD